MKIEYKNPFSTFASVDITDTFRFRDSSSIYIKTISISAKSSFTEGSQYKTYNALCLETGIFTYVALDTQIIKVDSTLNAKDSVS